MYSQYYGLREEPFGVTPDPHYLYLGGIHAEALASLIYGIENNRGFLALIGPPGTGKTTLLFHLLESFRESAQTAFIFQTKCNSNEFIRYLSHELGIEDSGKDLVQVNNLFNELLVRAAANQKRVLIVIDEAQNLDRSVLETVRLLSNFETPHSKLLQIILAGQTGLAKELAHYDLRQLRQRLAAVIHLRPLSANESSEYIDMRLKIAGYTGPPLFTQNARELLIDQSEGIPRKINIFCFNALSIGYALHSRVINEAIVQEVIDDSSLEEQPFHALALDRVGANPRTELRESVPVPQAFPARSTQSATTPARLVVNAPARPVPNPQHARRAPEKKISTCAPTTPKPTQTHLSPPPSSKFGPREQSVIESLHVTKRSPEPIPANNARKRNSLPFTLTLLLLVVLWSGAVVSRFRFQTSSQASAPPAGDDSTKASSPATDIVGKNGLQAPSGAKTDTNRHNIQSTSTAHDRPRSDNTTKKSPASSPADTIDLTNRNDSGERHNSPELLAANRTDENEHVDPFASLGPNTSNISTPGLPANDHAIDSVVTTPTASSISLEPSPRKSTPSHFVTEAQLTRSDVPEYPEEARRTNLEGSVVLMATIATDGRVQKIERISGNPMLAGAASRSVRGWHYRPASVNGRPVEAKARIVLNFSLRSKP